MTSVSPILTVRPVTKDDEAEIRSILDTPRLARRNLYSGIQEVHPVEWSTSRRSFGIRLGSELFGSVELTRDEDERTIWELAVVLADHKRALDGARSAVAAMHYAFRVLGARSVWFWAPKSNDQIRAFAEQLGFVKLNSVRIPGDRPAVIFELDDDGWDRACRGALDLFLTEPVRINDHEGCWVGEGSGFVAVPND